MALLLARLQSDGPAISARVIAQMYEDPFWTERFGEPAQRQSASTDGDWHVRYLVTVVQVESPAPFVEYASSLRRMLTARGMCTHHVVDNFVRLRDAFAAAKWSDADLLLGALDAGVEALVRDGDAGAIDALVARPSGGDARTDGDAYLLSYLADAVARERPDAFAAHVHFLEGWRARRGDAAAVEDDLARILRRVETGAPDALVAATRVCASARG